MSESIGAFMKLKDDFRAGFDSGFLDELYAPTGCRHTLPIIYGLLHRCKWSHRRSKPPRIEPVVVQRIVENYRNEDHSAVRLAVRSLH